MKMWHGMVLGLIALACSAEVADSRGLAGADASPETRVEANGTLLAKVTLSPTHEIVFYEHQALQVLTASEKFHADLDRSHQTLAARGVRTGMPMHEIYRIAAGAEADPAIIDYLQLTEGRFAASLEHNTGSAPSKELAPTYHAADPEAEYSKTTTIPEPVATISQALCSEPPWDWPADEAWFKSNFCYVAAQYCDTLDASHVSGKGIWRKNSDAVFFNQSHCSNARSEVWRYHLNECGCCPCWERRKVAEHILGPRNFVRVYQTSGWPYAVEWKASIISEQGNFTGLTHFLFT